MSIKDESQIKDQIRKSEVPMEGINFSSDFGNLCATYQKINASLESLGSKTKQMQTHSLAKEELEDFLSKLTLVLNSQFSAIRQDNMAQTTTNLNDIYAKMQLAHKKIDDHKQQLRHRLCKQAAHLLFRKRSLSCSFAKAFEAQDFSSAVPNILRDSKLQVVERLVEGGDSDSDLGNGRSAGVQVNMFVPHKGDVANHL